VAADPEAYKKLPTVVKNGGRRSPKKLNRGFKKKDIYSQYLPGRGEQNVRGFLLLRPFIQIMDLPISRIKELPAPIK
jgi:hypothetical protein